MNNLGFVKYTVGDIRSSMYYHQESLKLKIELSDKLGICVCLVGISEVISGDDQFKAAMLLGAAEEALNMIDEKMEAEIQIVFDRTFSLLKEKLGDEKFIGIFNEGKKMKLGEAVESILSV